MNIAAFQQAQQAYERNDFAGALEFYNTVLSDQNFPLQAGEFGLVHHQMGNCYVKLENYPQAISAYMNATSDNSYVSMGTVYYNLGMAYAYMSDFGNAINNFQTAINTENYRSKYKAYTAMGNALMKSGKSADAAASFRNAAMDNTNPDPTRALLNLGVCFMALNRPEDAITVYKNAFQYNMVSEFENRLNANLGQAYVACGQMENAVHAFEESLRDKSYKLSDSASVDYQRAIAAISKGAENIDVSPVGSPADSAPFDDEQELFSEGNQNDEESTFAQPNNTIYSNQNNENTQNDEFAKWSESTQAAAYQTQKKKHPFKIILIVFLFLLAACIVAGSVLFCFGFGFPSQEMVAKDYFSNPIGAKDKDFSSTLSETQIDGLCSMISQDPNATVQAVERSVNQSTVYVSAKTDKGADITYKLIMNRELIG